MMIKLTWSATENKKPSRLDYVLNISTASFELFNIIVAKMDRIP